MTDAKGAQTEQLVDEQKDRRLEEILGLAHAGAWDGDQRATVLVKALRDLWDFRKEELTALSECQKERERAALIRDTAAAELREARDHQYEKRKEAEAALSECRERGDEYQVRARAALRVVSRHGLVREFDSEYTALAAQPPSEASEAKS